MKFDPVPVAAQFAAAQPPLPIRYPFSMVFT